jgi:hypothetical protein
MTCGRHPDHKQCSGSGQDRGKYDNSLLRIVTFPAPSSSATAAPVQPAEGTVVDLDLGNTILLVGVSATQLTDSNFSFEMSLG